jgi:3-oxoadipate enol-lactonase
MHEFNYESGGTRLFAVEEGTGPMVAMLHGPLADHLAALPFIASLAGRYRVVVPDLRSSGRSWDPRPLTWDALVDDLLNLLKHLGIEKAVIGGVSGGSGVAVRFALCHPEHVAGLVLVNPVYAGVDRGLTDQQKASFEFIASLGSRANEEGVQVLRPLFAQLPEETREKALAMLDGFDAGSVVATTSFLGSGDQPFQTVSELRRLQMPVLIIPGNDPFHPAEVSELYAANISQSKTCATTEPASVIEEFCNHDARW